ncbi:hypothetical protein BC835DRAFT_1414227 [Cytidiella melzeri]|nr:hypothetical protein BC835DRAFT_1414227 [Cytidiella melzeri]
MFAALVALAVLAPSAFATVSMTAPVATTTWAAGQQVTIAWTDDNVAPLLSAFGPSAVGIFVGGTTTQAEVFHIADNVNVATTAQINWTVDGSFGPSSNVYFVRFTSNSCTDNSTMHYPCEAFSAKFALSNMNGNFNSTIQQIADGTAAGASGSASVASVVATSVVATKTSAAATTPSSAASHSSAAASGSASAKAATSSNGASALFTSAGLVAAVASLVGSMML